MQEYQQIEKAIAVQESLRGTEEDAILDATIATLRERLTSIRANQPLQVRKQVTMLFIDVVSSTTMAHQLDPEDNLAVMDTALKRLIIPVENHGGRVIHFQGDGFNAIFGHPYAHENDPRMAILAGLGILRAADEYSAELKTKWGIKDFKVRIGINTGLVVIGGETEAEDTMAGTAINLAARLESAAEPGSILISHHTYQHVRGIFDLEPMDPIQYGGYKVEIISVADAMNMKVGDTMDLSGYRYSVVGIYESKISWEEIGGITTLRDAQVFMGRPRKVTMFAVRLKDPQKALNLVEQINREFPDVHAALSGDFVSELPDMQNSSSMMKTQ